MYAVAYRFTLLRDTPDAHAEFKEVWTQLTLLFKATRGALGSRLHKGEGGVYHAYAQWPDAQTAQASRNAEMSAAHVKLAWRWSEVCGPSEVLFAGDVVADLTS